MTDANKTPATLSFKAFNQDLTCRDFQFRIGEKFTMNGQPVRCTSSGFHSCEYPLDTFKYYEPGKSRWALVEAGGAIDRSDEDTKIASAEITIKAELKIPELVAHAIEWITSRCKSIAGNHSTGNRSASSATGYQSASSATGDRSASSATGIGSVALNVGRYGKARAGKGGAIVLCRHDDYGNLLDIRAAKIGDQGLEADVFYTLNDSGNFVPVE